MKDLVIKGKWIRRELIILAVIFIISVAANVIGIIIHNTKWIELLSQLHVVIILTAVLYILVWVVRLIVYAVVLPFRNIKNNKK